MIYVATDRLQKLKLIYSFIHLAWRATRDRNIAARHLTARLAEFKPERQRRSRKRQTRRVFFPLSHTPFLSCQSSRCSPFLLSSSSSLSAWLTELAVAVLWPPNPSAAAAAAPPTTTTIIIIITPPPSLSLLLQGWERRQSLHQAGYAASTAIPWHSCRLQLYSAGVV